MHKAIREGNKGIVRACADDIGICLARLKHLQVISPIFILAEELAGLKLKPVKCVIVPLCELSERVRNDIVKWLQRNLPAWEKFAIEDATKLLGFYIGPKAGRKNWADQCCKVRSRVQSIQHAKASVKLNTHTYNSRVVPVTSYIAQLLPIPKKLMQLEHAMMHTTLRMPQNSLCHSDFMHLHRIGGPNFRSICAASFAALIRTALKTVTSWRSWILQLEEAADMFLPAYSVVRGYLSVPCWDSPPIAVNLREAACGLPHHPTWARGLPEVISKLEVPSQKVFYAKLVANRFSNTLNDTFKRRLTSLFQPYELDFQQAILLDRCWATLKKCRVADAVKIIKTWSNGWATSSRYHEGVILPCLFGCKSCTDNLQHYMQCPHLFALWTFLAGDISSDPLVRWGLIGPEPNDFLQIAAVFSGYHAIRREFKRKSEMFVNNVNSLTGAQLRVAWTVFADTFFVEAREAKLTCRRFSVTSFLNFLHHNSEFASCIGNARPDVQAHGSSFHLHDVT